MVIADRVFFPALFHDFLLFVFCLSGYCAGVGKNPKTVSSLGSICNSSINCLHISNNRRFGQVPRMETGTLHGISMCSGKHNRCCCTTRLRGVNDQP